MKFAPIIPWKYGPASMTDYHLILAHQVVADMEYRDYYRKLPEDHTIILDNSVIELGCADTDMIAQAMELLSDFPGELIIVAPDVLRESDATIFSHLAFLANKDIVDSIEQNKFQVMIVPQGVDHIDWKGCLSALSIHLSGEFSYVGIPRLTEDFKGGRRELFMDSGDLLNSYRVHLLGIQHTLREVEWAKEYKNVVGCDSSLPIRAAFSCQHSTEVRDLRTLPDPDRFQGSMMESVRLQVGECCDFVSAMHP